MESNPYLQYAQAFRDLARNGQSLPFGGMPRPTPPTLAPSAPVALILSPHPDDECIIGGLPLRLMRDAGVRIVNVAVTLGSSMQRREGRLNELKGACDWIGFELQETGPGGLERVNLDTRENDPDQWASNVQCLADILEKWAPQLIFFPHAADWNGTHIGVHHLAMDALDTLLGFESTLVETEYWGQMPAPNLMVEIPTEVLADLLGALSHHQGELERNAFHLGLPAWMQDNVRLGAEVVGGQGGEAPDYDFATLYRVSHWRDGEMRPAWNAGRMMPISIKDPRSFLVNPA